ncbi:hypothetical protein D3C75_1284920 [compost metagenome]
MEREAYEDCLGDLFVNVRRITELLSTPGLDVSNQLELNQIINKEILFFKEVTQEYKY